MAEPFCVGILSDLRAEVLALVGPILAEIFEPLPHVTYAYFEPAGNIVSPAELAPYDAVISVRPRFTAASFSGQDRLATIARWGVGYDMIDVPACTAANVLLSITIDG